MQRHKFLLITAIYSIALIISSCSGGKKEANAKEAENLPEDIVEMRDDQIKLAGIETSLIEERTMSGTLKVSGTITASPQDLASVSMPMGGFVKSTSLLPGSSVRKGQILAIIENPEFIDIQQNYLEVKSKLEYTEAEYKRQSELYKNDVASKKNIQLATSEFKALKAQQRALEQKLLLIGINPSRLSDDRISRSVALTSPISGYVKTVNVAIGKSVAATDVLFEIVNTSHLLLELTLFEKDADKVKVGETIHFYINNETEQHDAKVYQTSKSVGSDRSLKVYAYIQGECKNVLPGMYANALVKATGSKVMAVPSDAVVSFDDKDYIFVFDRNKTENGRAFCEYHMVQVHKGVSDDGFIEIVLPKQIDRTKVKVVTKGAYNLLAAKKNAGEMSC
jgi:RND family efflux transporter MFP subunit